MDAGQKWQGLDTELQLSGWSKTRRVVVLRRPLREGVAKEKNSKKKAAKQLTLDLPEATYRGVLYEYAVLVTSLKDEVRTIAQHYRDRGDSEMSGFLKRIKTTAEQLTQAARWRLILSAAFQHFLRGKVLGGTGRLAEATG